MNLFGVPNSNLGRDYISKWIIDSVSMFSSTQHSISNINIIFDDNDDNKCQVRAIFNNPNCLIPKMTFMTVQGWYIHKMVKGKDNKWRSSSIQEEICNMSILNNFVFYIALGLIIYNLMI